MNKEKLVHQHFVGQVADKIGMDETIEMMKASKKAVDRFGVEDATNLAKKHEEDKMSSYLTNKLDKKSNYDRI